jgi:proline iminopeptidase
VPERYPAIDPFQHGLLEVDHGNRLYWEVAGSAEGKPALVLHGGPGSGCQPWHRQMFDPAAYRVVLFDQRGCGRSSPHAGDPGTSLEGNDLGHQLADIEALRELLGIDRWLVWGGSFGCDLALAYAERHPQRVTEMVLWGVTTASRAEEDWLFRGGAAAFFPQQWQRLLDAMPEADRGGDPVEAYSRLLESTDADVRHRAAEAWCLWESATPDWPPREGLAERYRDPRFALAFARLVTHYVRHHHFLEDGQLLRDVGQLAEIPAVLVQGRFDFQSPPAAAWNLSRAWPAAELVMVGDGGHGPGSGAMTAQLVAATDRFAGVAD